MSERDLVGDLRLALARAGDNWRQPPSLIRRRLDDVLDSDAVAHRSKVHLLVVAAEEKIPTRLERFGREPARIAELAAELAATRGWTTEAAQWSVMTWAEALEPPTHDTIGMRDPGVRTSVPETTELPEQIGAPERIELPESIPLPERTELPTPMPRPASLPPPVGPPLPPPVEPRTPAGPPTTPRAKQRAKSEVEQFLKQPVDAGFIGFAGTPVYFFISFLVMCIIGLVAMVGLFVIEDQHVAYSIYLVFLASAVVTRIVQRSSPQRWLALQGDQVQLIGTRRVNRYRVVPTKVLASCPRSEVTPCSGWPASIMIGDARVYFIRHHRDALTELAHGAAK